MIPQDFSKMNATIRIRILLFITYLATSLVMAQDKNSKGDEFFFAYDYNNAIVEYQKEMAETDLSNGQLLNLADSYFQTQNYRNASNLYMQVNKEDSIISNHRFNKMLQSLAKISEPERINSFVNTKSSLLSNELLENADFNIELFEANSNKGTKNFQLFNIDANSQQSDFSPTFYTDRFLFSSGRGKKSKKRYEPGGEAYLDIFIGRFGQDGNILSANQFSEIPDSKYHKATPYYSEKLKRLFYILSNTENGELSFDENGRNALALGIAYDDGTFRFLLKDLSTSFYYPFYSEASGRMYFAANFKDSYGGTDLYYVQTSNGQVMSEPINLGPRINSPGNEIAPYIFDNSLYFSSDVFYGLGGMDIYKSNIQEDNNYSIPVNLGKSINSTFDDFGFIIKEHGSGGYLAYFASNRPGGKGKDDIYGLKTNELPGLKTLMFKGQVVNKNSGSGINNTELNILTADGEVIRELVTAEDGTFQLEIPWRDEIMLTATKEKHSIFAKSFDKISLEELQKNTLIINMAFLEDMVKTKEDKPVIKLNDFFFVPNKSEITPAIAMELDKVVAVVQEFPEIKLQIESHTDSRGSTSSNKRVSQMRSDAVRDYLISKGVQNANIAGSIGYGEEKILNNCTNGVYCIEFLHNKNLRTLIVVANYDTLK